MESIKDLFGEATANQRKRIQGGPVALANFQKSYKCGDLPAVIDRLQVHFNNSKLTLMIQFEMNTTNDDEY